MIRPYYRDFGEYGQGGDGIIFSSIYTKYWQIGFTTRLYEALCPEAYHDSLRRVASHIALLQGQTMLDAGCGSGLLLPCVADRLRVGGHYLGMDILPAGLAAVEEKARRLGVAQVVSTQQADLSRPLPVEDGAIDCAAAHFSVYTLSEEADRRHAWQELYRVVKPGGCLIAANPTSDYDASQIIHGSIESLGGRVSSAKLWILKYGVYPLTLRLGLKHIQRQIQKGKWHGYTLKEFCGEIEIAGFSIEHTESVYAGSGILIVARKPFL